MNTLPLHPLLVHIPVVMLPLTALLVLVMPFSKWWFKKVAPFALVGGAIGAVGALLAAQSGEELLLSLGEHSSVLERHAELGDATAASAVVFFVLFLIFFIFQWDGYGARLQSINTRFEALRSKVRIPYLGLATVSAIAALVVLVLVVLTGHAGAQSVWQG